MNRSVALTIDTSVSDETKLVLAYGRTRQSIAVPSGKQKAQALLPAIVRALAQEHLALTDITEITVMTGPGSFTGLRVGIAVANVLGTFLDIPVNGKKSLAMPVYS